MSIFRRNRKEAKLIVLFSTIKFLVCLLSISRFGFHRDELLHLALSEHMAWGYLETPPFISAVSWVGTHLFGDSLFATRLLPSLFGALTIYLTGLMTLSMGGKRFSISVACLGMIVSPAFLASGYLLHPLVFDQFFWALAAFLIIQYIKTKKISYLYWFGAAAGLGMLNKYTMLLYVISLLTGVLLSSQRRLLFTRHLWGAIILGTLIFLPNLLWQAQHHLPLLKHLKTLREIQPGFITPASFLFEQLFTHATGLLIWLAGFVYLFFSRVRSRYIFISGAYLIIILLLSILHGKVYYSFGAYPALFAAGGCCWQRVMTRLSIRLRYGILTLALLPCLLLIPAAAPVLPFQSTLYFFRFSSEKLGFNEALIWEDRKIHAIPQGYGDMLGWDELTSLVHQAYTSLNAKDRAHVIILAGNYGQAGAIDHIGKPFNLPKSISLGNSYVLWSPENIPYQSVILVGDKQTDLNQRYSSILKIGEVTNPYAREKGTSVWLLRQPATNVNDLYREKRQAEMASMISY
jgi:hypothetical protein